MKNLTKSHPEIFFGGFSKRERFSPLKVSRALIQFVVILLFWGIIKRRWVKRREKNVR